MKDDGMQKLKDTWLDFGLGYLNIAQLACAEMIDKKHLSNSSSIVKVLFIPSLFNIKHGIEVCLKSLFVSLQKKELIKNDEIHDQVILFKRLAGIMKPSKIKKALKETISNFESNPNSADEEYVKYLKQSETSIETTLIDLEKLIKKYQNLEFLKEKIKTNFTIEDSENTTFKYPQNRLHIKLDYGKILEEITEMDIKLILIDSLDLQSLFIRLFLTLSYYHKHANENNI